jgi:hypothetical protein
LGDLENVDCINLLTCKTGGGIFAPELAKSSGKYVGGATKRIKVFNDGSLDMRGGTWRIFNSKGVMVDEFNPTNIQTIIKRTESLIKN